MNGASTLPFPDSSTLTAWRRRLDLPADLSLWVGHLHLHRVEAAVEILERVDLPPPTRFCLRALLQAENTDLPPETVLEKQLGLPSYLARPILRDLVELGLLRADQDRVEPTDLGRAAGNDGKALVRRSARKEFAFAVRPDSDETAVFLPLPPLPSVSWVTDERRPFRPQWLQTCIAREPAWKKAMGFPMEIVAPRGFWPAGEVPFWKDVVVDRTERVFLLLVGTGAEGRDTIRAYAATVPEWELAGEPVLEVPAAASGLADLLPRPTAEEWQTTWRTWAQAHALEKYAAAMVHSAGNELLIRRAEGTSEEAGEPLPSDAWVLAGSGPIRAAACLRRHGATGAPS